MSDSQARNHEYHLVDPSPWPIICSVGAFVTAFGGMMYLNDMPLVSTMPGSNSVLFFIGLVIALYGIYSWWGDVIKEAEFQGHHTPIVQLGLRYGMFLFIISEIMFFVAWFWAYFNASIFPTVAIGSVWPPADIQTLDPWHLPLINTIILLTSGTTVTWAHYALQEGDRKTFTGMLLFTILLGASFTSVQAYEYIHATFSFDQNIYSSTFYMATGFHGAHVLIGTIFLTVCLFRGLKGHFTPDHHFGFEAASWYWHFVDAVWLFLFVSIYVAGAGAPGIE